MARISYGYWFNNNILEWEENMIKIIYAKREEYLEAWKKMLELNRGEFKKDWRMKHVWPGRFNQLQTEIDNFCTIAYDGEIPVGVFGAILTKYNRVIGKQIVVSPTHRGKKIGQALIIANERQIRDYTNVDNYTIVCLDSTSKLYEKYWGLSPFKGPMKIHKDGEIEIPFEASFNIDIRRNNFDKHYSDIISGRFDVIDPNKVD